MKTIYLAAADLADGLAFPDNVGKFAKLELQNLSDPIELGSCKVYLDGELVAEDARLLATFAIDEKETSVQIGSSRRDQEVRR